MEKIKARLLDIPEDNQAVNALLEQLQQDGDVVALCRKLNIPTSIVTQWPLLFTDYVTAQHQCRNCAGLDYCPYQPQGYRLNIQMVQDSPVGVMKPCEKQIQVASRFEHRKYYRICDLSSEALLRSLNNIDLTKETEPSYINTVKLLEKWITQPAQQGLYLYGPMGVGKTYLASCLTNDLAKKGITVAFVNVPQFSISARGHIEEKDYLKSRLDAMSNVKVLVLDDIGAEYVTSWFRDDLLFTVLDSRMEHHRATFFTSNCDFKALESRMMYNQAGEKDAPKAARLIERIRTLSLPVLINGSDRR